METTAIVFDICRDYLEDQPDFPDLVRKRLLGMCRARDLPGLASATSMYDPALHGSYELRVLRQVEAFFKKNALFVDDERCTDAAIDSFTRAEKLCRITNRRLDYYYLHRDRLDPDMQLWLSKMERAIHGLLAEFKGFQAILPSYLKLTSGATATLPRARALPPLKLKRVVDCSPKAVPYLTALQSHFGYRAVRFRELCVNRVEFVPKNFKTHRTIACEPTGNVPLQLAFDTYAKAQLKRKFKVDLSSQVLNQRYAKEGSISNGLATIDLSMASDTLAYNTVAWLLPQDWFEYVEAIRSPMYIEPRTSQFRRYAKFSSMGNGTTFVLETLIFTAAVRAVGSKRYAVYGDDIVIESELYEPLVKLLAFLGFIVNNDKSFASGPFRESCGADFHNGEDITPFYLREWGTRKSILSHNVNGLAAISIPEGKLWQRLKALIKERSLALVPFNMDSMSGIFVDMQTCYDKKLLRFTDPKTRAPSWGPWFRGYLVKQPTKVFSDSRSLFLWHLERIERFGPILDPVPWYPVMGAENRPKDARSRSDRIPTLSHKYIRKWVRWFYPATGDRKSVV